MSNYRVRQVLALGQMPDRQLRLLVALATWMNDETPTVRLAFKVLTETMGTSADTAIRARRDAREARRLSYVPGSGRGHVTLWTIDPLTGKRGATCAPPSEDVKGGQPGSEKGGNPAQKGGAALRADQQEPERLLERIANTSGSLSRALGALAAAVPALTEREIESISDRLKNDPAVQHPGVYLQAIIDRGDGPGWAAQVLNGSRRGDIDWNAAMARAQARERRPSTGDRAVAEGEALKAELAAGPRTGACKHGAHRDCAYSWCACTCHAGKRERLDDAAPLATIVAGIAERQAKP